MRVDVNARFLNIPEYCACCHDKPQVTLVSKATRNNGNRYSSKWWAFYYCKQCACHIIVYEVGRVIAWIVAFVALAGIFDGSSMLLIRFMTAIGVYCLFTAIATSLKKPICTSTKRAVTYITWYYSHHSFYFASAKYADNFMRANGGHVVEGPKFKQSQAKRDADEAEAERDKARRERLSAASFEQIYNKNLKK